MIMKNIEKIIAIASLILGALLFVVGCMMSSMPVEVIGCFFLFLAIAFFDYCRSEKRAAKQQSKRR